MKLESNMQVLDEEFDKDVEMHIENEEEEEMEDGMIEKDLDNWI